MSIKAFYSFFGISLMLLLAGCQKNKGSIVMIETDHGSIKVKLYDSTPIHKANFLKLAGEGYYDGTIFHRVIPGFMVQGGDPHSKTATPDQTLGQGDPGYTLEAEIGAPHFRGALSAARTPDNVNPQKRSSGSQFFIVTAGPVVEAELDQISQMKGVKYTEEQRSIYLKQGGTPFLDKDYTVFGEVVEGMDVVEKIEKEQTNQADRPVKDIKMKIKVL